MKKFVLAICKTIQGKMLLQVSELLHDLSKSINTLLSQYPTKNLGVFKRIICECRLNQVIAENCAIDNLFVYPAMSDAVCLVVRCCI